MTRRAFRHRASGFTLVEFVIVAAIIGIVITLAIPNWLANRSRAAQAEVYANLNAGRKLMETYHSDSGTYTDNLKLLGFAPVGNPRYIYGFTSDSVPAASGKNDTQEISGTYSKAKMLNLGVPLTELDLPVSTVTQNSFQIGAAANIDYDATMDLWIMDKANGLNHVTNDVDN